MAILITGGTGGLGRPTTELLTADRQEVRVLSRKTGPGLVTGDLATGEGLREALDGVDTVLHLATTARKDSGQTRTLIDAARSAGVRHLVYISIVGIEGNPYGYYRDKLACERLIEASGIPYTILRATQFHSFVGMFLRAQRRLPVLLVLNVSDQPIAVEEVAGRLAELAVGAPTGRVADIGGPEQATLRELAETWQQAHETRKPIWTLRIPGRIMAAFRTGRHMTALPGFGRQTFAEYAAKEARRGTNEA